MSETFSKKLCGMIKILAIFFIISGCTHSVAIRPSVSPVAYEFADKRVPASVAVYVYPELLDYTFEVYPSSYTCSAWNFRIEIGDPIRNTVQRIAEASFEKAFPISSFEEAANSYDYVITISLLDVNANITFNQGFSITADASAELNLKVNILGKDKEKIDQFVVGYSSRQTGGAGSFCAGGSQVIDMAFQQCLKNISIQLAEKLTRNQALIGVIDKK
jgi:hypothetical protein